MFTAFCVYTEFEEITREFIELKELNNKVVDLLQEDFLLSEKAEKINNCGDWLGFSPDNESGELKLVTASFCRERLCHTCQKRKSLKMYANTLKVVEYLKNTNIRYIHLVLTVPNCAGGTELNKTVENLFKSFGKFYKYKECKAAFKGCLRCLEISYNDVEGNFHPHLHCLIAVKASYFNSRYYLTFDRLQSLWTKACKSERPLQISVGAIKGDISKGVAEVCKYCVKPFDYDKLDRTSAHYVLTTLGVVLKGQRCIQKYGVIKEAFKALALDADEDTSESSEAAEVYYFGYDKTTGKYRRLNNDIEDISR